MAAEADWDGDSRDIVGVVHRGRPDRWSLRNYHTSGFADISLDYGDPGMPFAGDWDGDGVDTPAVVFSGRPNRWFLRNSNTTGFADVSMTYGDTGEFVVGDWNGDSVDPPGSWTRWLPTPTRGSCATPTPPAPVT